MTIRVGIVGEVRCYRESLLDRLARDGSLSAVDLGPGDASSLARAVETDPDAILVDLPIAEACSFGESALDRIEGTRLLAICRDLTIEDQVTLAEAGFVGFVPAIASVDDLAAQIRSAMRDESECSPQLAGALLRTLRKRSTPPNPPLKALSQRERQVAALLQHRYSNKQIAAQLGIEFGTAKNHVHNVLAKLHVDNRWDVLHLGQRAEPQRSSSSQSLPQRPSGLTLARVSRRRI